jgi:hypothetical protein
MFEVVAGVVGGDVADRLHPPLGMHPGALPLGRREPVPEREVRLPQRPEQRERPPRIRGRIAPGLGPVVLIERLDRRSGGRRAQSAGGAASRSAASVAGAAARSESGSRPATWRRMRALYYVCVSGVASTTSLRRLLLGSGQSTE